MAESSPTCGCCREGTECEGGRESSEPGSLFPEYLGQENLEGTGNGASGRAVYLSVVFWGLSSFYSRQVIKYMNHK